MQSWHSSKMQFQLQEQLGSCVMARAPPRGPARQAEWARPAVLRTACRAGIYLPWRNAWELIKQAG